MADEGIHYDASLFPGTRGHGGYRCPLEPHKLDGVTNEMGAPLWELPMTVLPTPLKRIAFTGGGYLRALPLSAILRAFRWTNAKGRPCVLYLHPRDLAPDYPRIPLPPHRKFKCYVGLTSTERKLKRLLDEFSFGPCGDVVSEWSHGRRI